MVDACFGGFVDEWSNTRIVVKRNVGCMRLTKDAGDVAKPRMDALTKTFTPFIYDGHSVINSISPIHILLTALYAKLLQLLAMSSI
jgi:hypothetical protein